MQVAGNVARRPLMRRRHPVEDASDSCGVRGHLQGPHGLGGRGGGGDGGCGGGEGHLIGGGSYSVAEMAESLFASEGSRAARDSTAKSRPRSCRIWGESMVTSFVFLAGIE